MVRLIAYGGPVGASLLRAQEQQATAAFWRTEEIVPEPRRPGTPRAGQVLAAIQPHADDIPLFAAGTVAKLVEEGCIGYQIRTTNDEKAGPGTMGETVLSNERDSEAVARVLGLKKTFHLNYRNHRLDDASRQDLRGRLIFLFRLLRVDIVVSYDPWGLYEENPDHYVTAQAVEAACWMAGGAKDYPEHLDAGLKSHAVSEKYYFARGPQVVNRVVDITSQIDRKIEANLVNVSQGPAGLSGSQLRAKLAARGLRLPLLGSDDNEANRQYIRHLVLDADSESLRGVSSDKTVGRGYGYEWAEPFHWIGPRTSRLEGYVSEHARPIP
jgi:LmbE family N-acetylglucosaminyl deacetylase